MEIILYSYFVSEFTHNPKKGISYQRIRRLLSNLAVGQNVDVSSSPLYVLLRYGAIDYNMENCFSLTKSLIIEGEKCKVGINLNNDLISANRDKILCRNHLGTIIFNSDDIDLDVWDVETQKFNLESYCSLFKGFWKIIEEWEGTSNSLNFKNAEIYNREKYTWEITPDFSGSGLYKVYSDYKNSNRRNFQYYYCFKNKIILIKKEEIERLNLVKTVLSMHKLHYSIRKEQIVIPDYFPLPTLIERLFVLKHMLTTSSFPLNRYYQFSSSDFRFFNKNVFNNQIMKTNE